MGGRWRVLDVDLSWTPPHCVFSTAVLLPRLPPAWALICFLLPLFRFRINGPTYRTHMPVGGSQLPFAYCVWLIYRLFFWLVPVR